MARRPRGVLRGRRGSSRPASSLCALRPADVCIRQLEQAVGCGRDPAGPPVVSCDPYPPGSATAGTVTYTWNDDTGNQDLGPGDSFTIAYDQCRVNDPADDIDELVNGTASLSGYTEVTDPSLWIGGDMTFSNLVVTETLETSPGVFEVLPDPVTVGGGLQIFFWEP